MPARHKRTTRDRAYKKLTAKRLFYYFLLVSIVSLLVGGALRGLSLWSARSWSGAARFTVVIGSREPKIISYQEGVGLATIPLAQNLELEGSFGVGKWKVGSFSDVGKIQGLGQNLLTLTLQNNFGLPIDGWFSDSRENFPFLIFDKDSNLNFFDRLAFASVVFSTPKSERWTIYLDKIKVVEKGADGVMRPTESSLPRELVDSKVAREGIGVGVLNKSNKVGLGKKAARVLEGMGAQVLWIRTEDPVLERCVVRGSKKTLNSLTSRKINRLFSCKSKEVDSLASSIEIVLGKEIAPEFP